MPRAKPITQKERDQIEQSVLKACGEKWLQLTPLRNFKKTRHRGTGLSSEKRLQGHILFCLQFMPNRDLREKPIPDVIAKAVEANDLQFLIKLGKILRQASVREEDYPIKRGVIPTLTTLELFLLTHWATAKDGLPELFYLTPEDLAEVCNHYLGVKCHTSAALAKLRQRLHLRPFKRQKIRVVVVGGKVKHLD